jgi:hypothetical protein
MPQLLTPQQFAHQPMLHRDPPSIRRHEVSASGHADIRSADSACCRAPASCWSMGSPSSWAAAPSIF